MERLRYQVRLEKFREQQSYHKLLERQYDKILKDCADSVLKTFHTPELQEAAKEGTM